MEKKNKSTIGSHLKEISVRPDTTVPEKCKYQNKGITLIALIVTIIVLLILAGITINLTIGQNGIFEKAKQAREEYGMQSAREKLILALAEYEVKLREETIYSILNNVQGLESIEPDDELAGLPYTVVVDGYEFLITEQLEVIYQGRANGILPEIISTQKNEVNENEAKITVQAKTEDKEGIEKVILIKNGVIVETKEVEGTKIEEEFIVTGNGKYKIKVVGKNKRQVISEEIEVTELVSVSGTLQAGTVVEGSVLLTVTGVATDGKIEKIEIYEGSTKIKEFNYTEQIEEKQETYQVEYMAFYEEKTYTAKIITANKTGTTNEVKAKNTDTIKTETDLKNLATVVNGETTFEGQTIKQIADITLTTTHVEIGTQSHPFKGTYNGQGKAINNIKINTTSDFQGLFGYVENATLQSIVLGTGSITGGNRVGGLVGYANNSIIDNVTNNGTQVTSSTTYTESGTYFTLESYGTSTTTWDIYATAVGGICGKAENTGIKNCNNSARVTTSSDGGMSGGIVGYSTASKSVTISSCQNNGVITGKGNGTGGIVGQTYGGITLESCINNSGSSITSSSNCVGGIVGFVVGTGGVIKNCTNNASIQGYTEVGGIIGGVYGDNTTKITIENNINTGTIQSNGEQDLEYKYSGVTGTYAYTGVGGIAGVAVNGIINQCINQGIVNVSKNSDTPHSIGGIIGIMRNATVTNSYNTATIGNSTNAYGAGGIVGHGHYNSYINNCYNTGAIYGTYDVAGICAYGVQINIRYCYNVGSVSGYKHVGGIIGSLDPYTANSYTNNYLYYCYNIGKVSATSNIGSIGGTIAYCNVNYLCSLTETYSSLFGVGDSIKTGTYATDDEIYDKADLITKVLSYGSEFKSDYSGTDSINNGYPILSWQ